MQIITTGFPALRSGLKSVSYIKFEVNSHIELLNSCQTSHAFSTHQDIQSMLFFKSVHFPVSPASLEMAMSCASKILRSDAFKNTVCSAYGSNNPHIQKSDLDGLLASDGVFRVGLARRHASLGSRAEIIRDFDPWTVYLNPTMLVEMTIREGEEQEVRDNPDIKNSDMINTIEPFKKGRPYHRPFNSLAYEDQKETYMKIQQPEPAAKKARRGRPPGPPTLAP